MRAMTKKREGFHNLLVQLPDVVFAALDADAQSQGESVARVLTRILQRHYRIKDDLIPKPRRAGAKPKTK